MSVDPTLFHSLSTSLSLPAVALVTHLLAATQSQAEAALSNITGFLGENQKIMADIDSLLARLSDVHASIALVGLKPCISHLNPFLPHHQINSPVRLSSEQAANSSVPYLSLQPPPGRQLEGGVQFEDLDLYLWPSAQYKTPSLIFYAGPVRFPDKQNGTQPENREVSPNSRKWSYFINLSLSGCGVGHF